MLESVNCPELASVNVRGRERLSNCVLLERVIANGCELLYGFRTGLSLDIGRYVNAELVNLERYGLQ